MSIKITMPALSPTMEEGNLAKWLVKEGDSVRSGDVIAEIETDKATMEVETVDEGIMAKIIVPAGTNGVKVNSLIAVLAEEDEDVAQVAKAAGAMDLTSQTAAAPAAAAVQPATPAAPQPAPDKQPVSQSGAASAAAVPTVAGGKIFASPLARRLAAQAGLDLSRITGSGPQGRIIERDVQKAKAGGVKAAQPAESAGKLSAPPASSVSENTVLQLFKPEDYEIAPHSSMRKAVARRLVESKQTVPHFYVTVDCALGALLELRAEINAAAPLVRKAEGTVPAYKLSVNDMVIKAVALALKYIPDANVSWLESGMIRHKHSDVSVAVSLPNGLITPIIRHAEEKSIGAISSEMKDLVKRARQMKLQPEEYLGGTTSVSNMGMFGVKSFSAIINPPQATIFAIGAGEPRAVVKDGVLAVADMMSVTLSVDHRAVDGVLAAELAQCFKDIIEKPVSMLI